MQESSSIAGVTPLCQAASLEQMMGPIAIQAQSNGRRPRSVPQEAVMGDHGSPPGAAPKDQDAAQPHMVSAEEPANQSVSRGPAQKSRARRGKKRGGEGKHPPAEAEVNDAAATDAVEVSPKPKRKYVKSGKFIGRFNDYQRKKGTIANQDGKAGGKRRNKRESVAIEGTETAHDGTAPAAASSPQLAIALESPFASETSQEAPPKPKRGRPKGSFKKKKAPAGSEAEPAKATNPTTAASKAKPRRRNSRKNTKTDAAVEPGAAVNQETAEEAGGNDYAEADTAADAAARLEMARKASTGDGSRLERPPVADSGDTGLSSVQAGTHPQADPQPDPRQADSRQDAAEGPRVQHGARVFNPVSTSSKPPHRLSKVTGREMLGLGAQQVGGPNGENDGPLHRDDSTFGEYMAALDSRSSSGNGFRRLNSSGNSGRLMEMLHGSDGWGKLVSELQQKEEADEQQPAGTRRKRARTPKDGLDPLAKGIREHKGLVEGATASASTEDSQASRPKRALPRFDYNVLNGTSGHLDAMLLAADMQQQVAQSKPKVHKKRQPKLDQDGNRPEVSVYAKAYNKVKAQFARIRREDTLLGVYGADAWGGASQERVKLQYELDRAREQVLKCKAIIRECVKFCEEAEGDKAIPSEHYDADGELLAKFIFCAKCLKGESEEDNDIVLCDGACNRGYHEQCLQPRIHAQELPEDEGWLCPACDAKADIILAINEEYGTDYDEEAPWHSLFADDPTQTQEKVATRHGPLTFLNMDLGDSDSDDSSFGSDDLSDHEREPAGAEEDDQATGSQPNSPQGRGLEDDSGHESSSGSDSSSGSELADLEDEQEALQSTEVDVTAPRAERHRAASSSPRDQGLLEQPSGTPGDQTGT
ncbi:hypothetical protein ABBQ32_012692 [Trebouxia sp. C0010 RCD-2024]